LFINLCCQQKQKPCQRGFSPEERFLSAEDAFSDHDYSIAVITFYLLRPLKLTNQNQSQIQSVQLLSHLPRKKVKVRILLSSPQLLF
jgi:hypothetical protein